MNVINFISYVLALGIQLIFVYVSCTLWTFISSSYFCMYCLEFGYVQVHNICEHRFSFLFLLLTALLRILSTILSRNGKSRHLCLAPGLWRPFQSNPFLKTTKFPSISSLLKCWLKHIYFFVPIRITVWFCLLFYSCYIVINIWMVNWPCIPRVSSTWSWCRMLPDLLWYYFVEDFCVNVHGRKLAVILFLWSFSNFGLMAVLVLESFGKWSFLL